jgi:hypothetical protein
VHAGRFGATAPRTRGAPSSLWRTKPSCIPRAARTMACHAARSHAQSPNAHPFSLAQIAGAPAACTKPSMPEVSTQPTARLRQQWGQLSPVRRRQAGACTHQGAAAPQRKLRHGRTAIGCQQAHPSMHQSMSALVFAQPAALPLTPACPPSSLSHTPLSLWFALSRVTDATGNMRIKGHGCIACDQLDDQRPIKEDT